MIGSGVIESIHHPEKCLWSCVISLYSYAPEIEDRGAYCFRTLRNLKKFLHQNRWANFNQIWHKASLNDRG